MLAGFVNVARGLDRAGHATARGPCTTAADSDIVALGGTATSTAITRCRTSTTASSIRSSSASSCGRRHSRRDGATGHLVATSLLLAACLVLTLLMLQRIPAQSVAVRRSPALALYGVLNGTSWASPARRRVATPPAATQRALHRTRRRDKLFRSRGARLWRTVKSRTGWLAAAAAVVAVINVRHAGRVRQLAEFFRFSSRRPRTSRCGTRCRSRRYGDQTS